MISWSGLTSLAQSKSFDSTSSTQLFLQGQINVGLHIMESQLGSFVTENNRTGTTASTTNVVFLPENLVRIKAFYVTVGTTRYNATEVYDEDTWQQIISNATSVKSNFLSHMFRRRNYLELFPSPSSANTWTMIYEMEGKDLSAVDYITGTVTSVVTVGTTSTVTGSGVTWTASMIGRFIQISTLSTQWYEIATVPSATTLTLVVPWQEGTVSAGSSYTIGEMARTPSSTHQLLVSYALWQYFEGIKKDAHFGPLYKAEWEQGLALAKETFGKRYSSGVIPSQRRLRKGVGLLNQNLFPGPIS